MTDLAARVAAVLALHSPSGGCGFGVCAECGQMDPCETRRVLSGEGNPLVDGKIQGGREVWRPPGHGPNLEFR